MIYSDDHGRTWQRGAIVVRHGEEVPNPSETLAVQLADGRVMLNIRNESRRHRRFVSFSSDGISGWSRTEFHEELIEPVCMASLIRISVELSGQRDCLVFANPVSQKEGGQRGPNYQFGYAKSLDRKGIKGE